MQTKKYLNQAKQIEPEQKIVLAPLKKPSTTQKKNFIFNSLSREKRSKLFEQKVEIPPVGFYRPNYRIIDERRTANLSFSQTRNSVGLTKSLSIFSEDKQFRGRYSKEDNNQSQNKEIKNENSLNRDLGNEHR